jgi:hypothetical protein
MAEIQKDKFAELIKEDKRTIEEKKSPGRKKGRPSAGRTNKIAVLLNDSEKDILSRKSQEMGLSMAGYLRLAALEKARE